MEIEKICKNCDHCVESKQGIKCFNSESEKFNQAINLKDEACENFETNFFVAPTSQNNNLFEELI